MKKIEQLTDAQEAMLPTYRDKFLEIGLSTHTEWNKPEIERLFAEAYKVAGLSAPTKFIYLTSPMAGAICAAGLANEDQVKDQVRDQVWYKVRDQVWYKVRDQVWYKVWYKVRDQVIAQVRALILDPVRNQVRDQVKAPIVGQVYRAGFGSQDSFWLGFYSFLLNEVGLTVCKDLVPLTQLANLIGWYWPFKDCVVVTPKPSDIYCNKQHRLHRDGSMALRYMDGWGVYALNGVRFTGDMKKFVITPATTLNAKEVLAIKNVEQRAEVIKKFGIDKLFYELQPRKLDTHEGYELYQLNVYPDVPRIYLKMQSPSVDEIHIEAVHPECETVEQALNWRNFGEVGSKFIKPLVLT